MVTSRRLRPSPAAPTASSILLLLLPYLVDARTVSYDSSDKLLVTSAWSTVETDGDGWTGNGALRASKEGARLRFSFAGEQISLYGSASSTFAVSIDGGDPSTSPSSAPTNSAVKLAASSPSPTRFFLANNLSRTSVHVLELEMTGNGTLMLDRVAVAYSNSVKLDPALLADGTIGSVSAALFPSSALPSSSPASSRLSSTSPSSASSQLPSSSALSLPSSASDAQKLESGSSNGGTIAGAVMGTLIGLTLLVLIIFSIRRKKQSPTSDEDTAGRRRSSYYNADTGAPYFTHRRSTPSAFLSAFAIGRPSPSPLRTSRADDSHNQTYNSGVRARHPFAAPQSGSYAPGMLSAPSNQTWTQRLTRAASWKRKADRLGETRSFYKVPEGAAVAAVAGPRAPPPQGPLPSVPEKAAVKGGLGDERVMEERWRDGPSLVQGGLRQPPGTVQVYGEALSDDGTHPSTPSTGRRSSAQPIVPGAHIRRRSLRQTEDPFVEQPGGQGTFSVPLGARDHPLPPVPAVIPFPHAPQSSVDTTTSFRNPFASTASLPRHSQHHGSSDSHGTYPGGASHGRGFSLEEESGDERASVEGATFERPITVQINRNDSGALEPEDISLFSPNNTAVPVRVSSKRLLADSTDKLVRPAAALARRPTLTKHESADDGTASSDGTAPGSPAAVVDGYNEQEVLASSPSVEAKHRSVLGLIESVESFDEELDGVEGKKGRREPPPGEEDRAAFFTKRERMPRYSAESDPRRPHMTNGSISRRS
ncbi:hypothetical protein JCM11641_000263 [Rhodosporidiobolus odoratus]